MEGKSPKKREIKSGLKQLLNTYHLRGLQVNQINTDNECVCIREEARPVNMNIVAAGEHVTDIARSSRNLREGPWGHVHRLSYKRYPAIIVIVCVTQVIKRLNQSPSENGLSTTISRPTLITGIPGPDYQQVKIKLLELCVSL